MNFSLQEVLMVITGISLIWAIRSHFKAYQREDSTRVADSVLVTERIAAINIRLDTMSSHISELQKTSNEMYAFRSQIIMLTEDIKSIKGSLTEVMKYIMTSRGPV